MQRYGQTLFLLIAVFAFAATFAASGNGSQAKVVVPLLKECEPYVKTFFSRIPSAMEVSHSIIRADYILDSHPAVSGYLEIRSSHESKDELLAIVNAFARGCYPISSTTISKRDSNFGQKLLETLELFKSAGASDVYVVNSDERFVIYFSERALQRKTK